MTNARVSNEVVGKVGLLSLSALISPNMATFRCTVERLQVWVIQLHLENWNISIDNIDFHIRTVAGLLHPGHRLDEWDLRLDREGIHEGGAREGHEVGRGVLGAGAQFNTPFKTL